MDLEAQTRANQVDIYRTNIIHSLANGSSKSDKTSHGVDFILPPERTPTASNNASASNDASNKAKIYQFWSTNLQTNNSPQAQLYALEGRLPHKDASLPPQPYTTSTS